MCGIVGYIGKQSAPEVVLDGLRTLEYRGYDSAGLAYIDAQERGGICKQIGRVDALAKSLGDTAHDASRHLAIGHTRWATHGSPTVANAHPHSNTDQTIFVVHNGIIENYAELRERLGSEGYVFASETDTEVIPHLIDHYTKTAPDFATALANALADLRGAYAVAVINVAQPDVLYAARLSSPLVIGLGSGEFIVASDPSAILAHTKEVIYLQDHELIQIGPVVADSGSAAGQSANKPVDYSITNFLGAHPVDRASEILDLDAGAASKGDYPDFMLKEIYEAPQTVRSATLGRVLPEQNIIKLGGLDTVANQLKHIDRIVIVACGTSYYAGLVGEYLIEEIAGIPVEVQQASEFKYRNEPFSRSTALLAISQSGETADTIAALKKLEDYGVLRLGIVNAVGSTIARMTDAGVYCHAGPELAVASTKAFIAQVMVLLQIALYLSDGNTPLFKPLLEEIDQLPGKIERLLKQAPDIEQLAHAYKDVRDFLFIGRGYEFPCALEGALKLKEVSYIHAEGYAAGEMKHGPLAMIDAQFPTFALAADGPLLEKTVSGIQEIRARSGPVVAAVTEGDTTLASLADATISMPATLPQTQPVLSAVVLQLFAYYVARARQLDVDRPRNLAKSVTVE